MRIDDVQVSLLAGGRELRSMPNSHCNDRPWAGPSWFGRGCFSWLALMLWLGASVALLITMVNRFSAAGRGGAA